MESDTQTKSAFCRHIPNKHTDVIGISVISEPAANRAQRIWRSWGMAGDLLPNGWRLTKLGDLGEVNRGRSCHRPRDAEHLFMAVPIRSYKLATSRTLGSAHDIPANIFRGRSRSESHVAEGDDVYHDRRKHRRDSDSRVPCLLPCIPLLAL